jgi:addiction module HigA family antidote
MTLKMHPSHAVAVGIWLREEFIIPYKLDVTTTANRLGVTRQAMSALLNGRAGLSAEMAIRFEKAFGVKADTLLRMQAAYELARAREHEAEIDVAPMAAAA